MSVGLVSGPTPLQALNSPTVWNEFIAVVHVLPTKFMSGVVPARPRLLCIDA